MYAKLRTCLVGLVTCAAAPGSDAVGQWAPALISSDRFESHGAFDPLTGDFYFVRSSPQFEGWRIKVSRCSGGEWLTPVDTPFAGDGVEADPWFDRSGRTVYFISTRTSDGFHRRDLDIWTVTRSDKSGWGVPKRMPAPINSDSAEWFPRMGRDGWLYFGSARPGGYGKTDIWRAHKTAAGWTVENAGPGVNSVGDEYEPLPAPDGRSLLIQAADGYYESKRVGTTWGPRARLGTEINENGSEVGATFSPSGRSLMFSRDAGAGRSGEFFVWHRSGREAWPGQCRPRR
jgi:hypothetical protein